MHRLTLILSDLYLPAEEAEEVAAAAGPSSETLPALEWLLRFADAREPVVDWRSALASAVGYAATVHLHAAMDHVRLDARGLLTLPADERAAWIDSFARAFGPALALHDDGVGGFFLTGLTGEATTVDPARLLGADIAAGIPRG